MDDAPSIDVIAAAPRCEQGLTPPGLDSLSTDPDRRHEEGGWIYYSTDTQAFTIVRVPSGDRATITLFPAPDKAGLFLVAIFHTHPHPAAEGWHTGPSRSDERVSNWLGVPSLIRAEDGMHQTGPPSRRGGLRGPPGFPM